MSQEPKRGHFAKEKGEIILREHEYDGIQEYDQKLPNWWLFTFYGAIAWLIIYWLIYYNSNVFQTDQQLVTSRILAVQKAKQDELEKMLATLDDSVFVHRLATDEAVTAAGEATYLTNCSACHAADLSAEMEAGGTRIPLPGLSLIDGEWKFGANPMDVFKIINDGSPPESEGHNGGAKMQAWGQILTAQQIAEVTAYIIKKVPADFADIPLPD
jgi:cytochrome c oxidase cbb3-type subunit III